MKAVVRTLVIAQIALPVLAIVVSSLTETLLPEALRDYSQSEMETIEPWMWLFLYASVPILGGLMVSCVGLFMFWPPARPLYVAVLIAGTALTPLAGPYVDYGWGRTLEDIGYMISGALIIIVYFSPARDLFEKSIPTRPETKARDTTH